MQGELFVPLGAVHFQVDPNRQKGPKFLWLMACTLFLPVFSFSCQTCGCTESLVMNLATSASCYINRQGCTQSLNSGGTSVTAGIIQVLLKCLFHFMSLENSIVRIRLALHSVFLIVNWYHEKTKPQQDLPKTTNLTNHKYINSFLKKKNCCSRF